MVTTKARVKAGSTEYVAIARQQIPLADPDAYGNDGLQGFDENAASRRFASKAAALRWLKGQVVSLPHMVCADIRQVEWEADDFVDDRYGLVFDAIEVDRHTWNYYVHDGVLDFDGDWRP